jgi:putative transposase
MAWKSVSLMAARRRFVKRVLQAQQPFAETCRLSGISRKTGYKWWDRFLRQGIGGLRDRSRRPKSMPWQTTACWRRRIRRVRRRHRRWGAKKIRAQLRRQHPRARLPAVRTITHWLQRWRLTRRRRARPPKGPQVWRLPLTIPRRANQVWTVDFKGWFRTADGQRVEPLTVRDLFSRYLLAAQLLPDQQWWRVRTVFIRLFRRHGLPAIIRTDNGSPFGSTGPAGLTRLSTWWTALGIRVEFIAPGHPEQNGAHEQMHRDMKAATALAVSVAPRAQQRRTNRWLRDYNRERPHEALGQRLPADCYQSRSRRVYRVQERLKYPRHWQVRGVRSNGQIKWQGRLRFIGEAFVGQSVGLRPVSPDTYIVYLARVPLGELRNTDVGGLRPAVYTRQQPTKSNPKV